MFYLIMIPALALSAWMLFRFRRLAKHDKVLFEFCQVRRDIMVIFRRDLLKMDREKYFALRGLLDNTDNAIHYYNENKATLFNFRKFMQWLKDSKRSAEEMENLKLPDDPEVLQIRDRFGGAMVSAFCAYTPFVRSEAVFRFSLMLLRAMARTGWRRAENLFQSAKWFKNFRSTIHRSGGTFCHR